LAQLQTVLYENSDLWLIVCAGTLASKIHIHHKIVCEPKDSFETPQHLCIIMSTYIAHDIMFEDAYNGFDDIDVDGLSVGSLDMDETLVDFPVQTATTTPTEEPQQTAAMKPHIVSMEDMPSVRKITTLKGDMLTPYDSLRLLVKSKQQSLKRSTECHTIIEDDSTSSFPRAFLSNEQTEPAPKHRKVSDPSLLHQACSNRNLSLETLQGILRDDAGAASRQLALFTEEKVYNYLSHHLETKKVRESYTYPINMALKYGFNATVIKSLIDAGKAVLGSKDGLEQEGSLHILLKHQHNHLNNANLVNAILEADPSSAMVEDRHFNTPLHVACRSGASMYVIRRLWVSYPGALAMRNFQGLTPLDVARTNGHMCNDGVAYFLWQKVQEAHLTV
jgi:hypothetical protein